MVKNFGDRTEVSQYRGRHVDEGGKCPIKIKRSNDENNWIQNRICIWVKKGEYLIVTAIKGEQVLT